MSFLSGIFLMLGIQKLALNDSLWIMCVPLVPFLIFAAVLNARRILKAVH
jgi:hypothetical protein